MGTEIEEGKARAETHVDVLKAFEPLIRTPNPKNKLFFNGDLGGAEAGKLIAEGSVDAVVLGRAFIGSPDLPRRLFEHLPLNEELGHPLDPSRFFSFLSHPSEGYVRSDPFWCFALLAFVQVGLPSLRRREESLRGKAGC
jgi:hypothetical protein